MTCSHNCTKSPRRFAAEPQLLGDPLPETHSLRDTENVIQKKGTVQRPECRSMARAETEGRSIGNAFIASTDEVLAALLRRALRRALPATRPRASPFRQ